MPRRPPSRTSSAGSSSVSWSLPSSANETCTEDQWIPLTVGGSNLSKLKCLNQCLLMVFVVTFLMYGWVTVHSEMKNMIKSQKTSESWFHQDESMITMEGESAKDTDHGGSIPDDLSQNEGYTSRSPITSSSVPTSSPSPPLATSSNHSRALQFCHQPSIEHNNVTLNLLYQCEGQEYLDFGKKLAQFANQKSSLLQNYSSSSQWGRQYFPIPANRTVLVLGNSHLRQISKTVVCQFSNVIQSIQILPSLDPSDGKQEIFGVEFLNGSRWISITNTVLAYSKQWHHLILYDGLRTLLGAKGENDDDDTLASLIDTVIFGKFTRYFEAIGSSYMDTMAKAESAFYERHPTEAGLTGAVVDFFNIAPPTLLEAAIAFKLVGGIISVPMFSTSDQGRAHLEWNEYQQALTNASAADSTNDTVTTFINKHVTLLNTREFIDELGLECGSDDRKTIGTCHESEVWNSSHTPETKRQASDMHRCAGAWGGHADLVAWSLVEEIYQQNHVG